MNNANGEAVAESEIHRLLQLHVALEGLMMNFCPMPDEVCGALVTTQTSVVKAIIDAKAGSADDVADKFRLAAVLISDPAGISDMADQAIVSALSSLAAWNAREREAIMLVAKAWTGLEAA